MLSVSFTHRFVVGLVAVTAITTLGGTPAQAATVGVVSVSGADKVKYLAKNGHTNRVVITGAGRTVTIDDVTAIRAGKGCKAVKGDTTKVRCSLKRDIREVVLYLYDRNDTAVNNSDLRMYAQGDGGNDTLIGGSRRDWLNGAAGNDKLYGRGGNNRLDGGPGRDRIYGGPAHDDVYAGSGRDIVRAGDGGDFVTGESGNDVLYGQGGGDALLGGEGNDRIHGGSGADQLIGEGGTDYLDGGANPAVGDRSDECQISGRDTAVNC